MSEKFYEGPVQPFEWSDEDLDKVREMLASDDELTRAYGEAYQKHCYIREFGGIPTKDKPEAGITAVGDFDQLIELEFRNNTEIDPAELTIGDVMELGILPAEGDTRVERVFDGVKKVEANRGMAEQDPNELDLFGSFVEDGIQVEAYMPKYSHQPTQWTIRFSREETGEFLREDIAEMVHAPIFGVDVSDRGALEAHVDVALRELTKK